MYDMLSSAFTDALNREGKTIYSYSDNTPYSVIFRKNSDKNKLVNRLSIFYPLNCGIHAGQLLTYGNKHFLVLNQETPENTVYYKSNVIETNAIIHSVIGTNEINMPVYAYDITDGLAQSNNVISVVNGNIHIIAEPNSIIKSLALDNEFDAVGRHWKIDNIISKDNVIHLYCEVAATTSHTYTVTITANDSYHKGESAQLTAVAKQDDTIVNNISLVWTSSDTSLATVDNTGLVKFLADGNVTITATWTSQSVSGTKSIAITEPTSYSLTVNGENAYTTGDTPTLTATAKIDGVEDTTATITWNSSDTNIATIDSTGLVTFIAAGSVIFTATWMEQNITATITVAVTKVDTYALTITNTSPIEVNKDTLLTVLATKNGEDVTDNSIYTFDFTSSDPSIAAITTSGSNSIINFSQAQTVTVTAKWHDIMAGIVRATTTKELTGQAAINYTISLTSPYSQYGATIKLGNTTRITAHMKNKDTGEEVIGDWHFIFTNIISDDADQITSWTDNKDGTCDITASSATKYDGTYFNVSITETITGKSVQSSGYISNNP